MVDVLFSRVQANQPGVKKVVVLFVDVSSVGALSAQSSTAHAACEESNTAAMV